MGRAVSFSGKSSFCKGGAKSARPPRPRFCSYFRDWGSHGGQPLQENETALEEMRGN